MQSCKILVPTGMLGSGCPEEAIARGFSMQPSAVAVDAGSTDSGPYFLATTHPKMTRGAVRRDLAQIIPRQLEAGIPLIIGSCGSAGTDAGVDYVADICNEILSEIGRTARIAKIYSEIQASDLIERLARGRVSPLTPSGPLTAEDIQNCTRIVGLQGPETMQKAIKDGAQIILCGRATDTAVLSCLPLMQGLPAGASWHAAKIAECGSVCTERLRLGGVMIEVHSDGFDVEPLHIDNRCTVASVSAHMLYENSDPFRLIEPGVVLDASEARYEQLDTRRVRVTGSRAETMNYTIKLEAARLAGYQTISFVCIREPKVLERFEDWLQSLKEACSSWIQENLKFSSDDYEIDFRPYGWNGLGGDWPPNGGVPFEVGLMVLVTAATSEHSLQIARACNPALLHWSGDPAAPMPSFAFPFSPAETPRGPVYEFAMNHVVSVDDPLELFRFEYTGDAQ
tara:strand:+ start:4550 stop:5911 length:1362 start_codon:yes stop_codon:yes gene_type:complete